MEKPEFVAQFDVVQGMTRRIESAIAEDPAQSWESVRERVKGDFAKKSRILYNRAVCQYPDGADLLAEAVGRIAPQIRSETVSKMRDALNAAVPNRSSRMALWSQVREIALSKNRLAIGALREIGEISDNGAGLLNQALSQTDLRIVLRCDIDPARPVEYLAGPQAKMPENPECEKTDEGNVDGETENGDCKTPFLTILRRVAVLLSITVAIAALIDVTVWDILPIPIPCDLAIFSWLPRC